MTVSVMISIINVSIIAPELAAELASLHKDFNDAAQT
jgi:hypothetical protein